MRDINHDGQPLWLTLNDIHEYHMKPHALCVCGMSEETIKKLEERLKCAICLDTYTDPKLLQCFHVFCRDCLVRLVVRDQQGQLSLTCPNCRQATPIPANGVTGLQSANDFLEIMKEHKKPKDSTTSQEGNVTCPNPSKKVSPYCSVHADKELELYCETCGELICFHCSLRGQKHRSHEYDLISSCYEMYKREMTSSLEPMEKQLTTVKKALADLDVRYGEISDQRAAIEADIHRTTQRLHEIIDVRKTELINQLHQETQEKLKGLAVQRDELETILAKLSSCLEFVRESLETSSQGEVMKMKTTIIKQVKELTATLQPDVLKPNTEADIEFIASTDVTAMCENYGQIGVPGSPDPSLCHATGKGLEVAVVGEESTAIVQANDFKGEPCKKQVTLQCELVSELTGVVVRGNVRRRGESQYEINYQPTIKGRHQLLIKIEDQHIRGSPFPVTAKMSVEKLGTPIRTIGGLNHPWGVVVNRKGEMVVTEFDEHCVTVLSPSGEKIQSFGTHGSGQGQFDNPHGVVVDSDGNFLVVDGFNHRIQKFAGDGRFLAAVGTVGEGPLQFTGPTSIAFNAANNKIYVADFCNNRIQVLNSDLTFLSTFGGRGSSKGQFDRPFGVSCDSSGQIFIADYGNHRIQVFTADGRFVRMFGQGGSSRGELNKPICIFVDVDGVVYVSENENHRISVFTSEGRFVTSFGSKGEGPGQFKTPRSIAVDNSGVVYVCDFSNHRIQLF